MISTRLKKKGILAKLLEECIRVLIKSECNNIDKLKIDISASSIQIIKGIVPKINIIAEDINYKDLMFDKIELESNEIKIILEIRNKVLNFKNNSIIQLKISLSEYSLRTILSSNSWSWISNLISKKILNEASIEDIKIKTDHILIKTSKDNNTIREVEKININTKKGKIYLENKSYNKHMIIPIEDKVCIEKINIRNNSIIIFLNSPISF